MPETRRQVAIRLAARAGVEPRTAQRWLDGQDGILAVDRAIKAAADVLGLKRVVSLPSEPDAEDLDVVLP